MLIRSISESNADSFFAGGGGLGESQYAVCGGWGGGVVRVLTAKHRQLAHTPSLSTLTHEKA